MSEGLYSNRQQWEQRSLRKVFNRISVSGLDFAALAKEKGVHIDYGEA